jgi:hypothetical protein
MHVLLRLTRVLRRTTMAPLLVAAIAAGALTACGASSDGDQSSGPEPSPSLSAEDQDAAAFENLYADFLSIDENTETREQLAKVLAGPALGDELNGAEGLRAEGKHVEGRLTYSGFEVTDHSDTSMVARVCSDTSGTTVFDSSGKPIPDDGDKEVSLAMKATRASSDSPWRISEIVRDDTVQACA